MCSIEEIISYFNFNSFQTENNQILDTFEEEHIFNNFTSFSSSNSLNLIKFIECLFLGSQHCSIKSSRRFLRLFKLCLNLIYENDLNSSLKCQIIEILFENMRLLNKENSQNYVEIILNYLIQFNEINEKNSNSNNSYSSSNNNRNINMTQNNNNNNITQNNDYDISSLLELLPQLVILGGEKCREYTIERLCSIDWPLNVIVSCASALVELNSTHTQDIEVIKKISSYLVFNSNNNNNNNHNNNHNNKILPIEDLPSLIYQLTAIASNTAPNNTRLLVLDAVADSLDKIADNSINQHNNNNTNNNNISSGSGRNLTYQVTSTITHHLALLISKDQVIIIFYFTIFLILFLLFRQFQMKLLNVFVIEEFLDLKVVQFQDIYHLHDYFFVY